MNMQKTPPRSTEFGILLNRAFGAFKSELHAALAEQGFEDLGPSFGYVFRLLDGAEPSLRELSEQLGMTPQGALKIVSDMVAKGYVERTVDDTDARVTRLVLTKRGRQALAAAKRFHTRFEARLRRRLGSARVSAARAVLESIVAEVQDDGVADAARPF